MDYTSIHIYGHLLSDDILHEMGFPPNWRQLGSSSDSTVQSTSEE